MKIFQGGRKSGKRILLLSLLIASLFLLTACGDELTEEEAQTLAGGGGGSVAGSPSNPANVNFDDGTTNGWTSTGLWHVSYPPFVEWAQFPLVRAGGHRRL